MFTKLNFLHGLLFSIFSVAFLFALHLLPINQLFIDPFSEAIKNHDLTDVAFSKFRDSSDPLLFDESVFIINSEVTDKTKIAEAVSFLKEKGIRAIGIDLLFSDERSYEDSILADVLDDERVILGFTFDEHDPKHHTSIVGEKSAPIFTSRTNRSGYVNLATDDGYSVRAFEPFHKVDGSVETALPVLLAESLNANVIPTLQERGQQKEWINYRRFQPGSANAIYPINSKKYVHYPMVGITQFLRDKEEYSKDFFVNKIVLIGFAGENSQALSMKDRYFTPLNEDYNGRSLPDMHGVVIHANIVSMLVRGDYILEIGGIWLYVISMFLFFINFLAFTYLSSKKLFSMIPLVRLLQAVEFIILFGLFVILLANYNIKIGFILIITAVILSYEFYEFYHHKLYSKASNLITKMGLNGAEIMDNHH